MNLEESYIFKLFVDLKEILDSANYFI